MSFSHSRCVFHWAHTPAAYARNKSTSHRSNAFKRRQVHQTIVCLIRCSLLSPSTHITNAFLFLFIFYMAKHHFSGSQLQVWCVCVCDGSVVCVCASKEAEGCLWRRLKELVFYIKWRFWCCAFLLLGCDVICIEISKRSTCVCEWEH